MAEQTQPASPPTSDAAKTFLIGYVFGQLATGPALTVDGWNAGVTAARTFDPQPPQGVGFRG